MRLLASRRQPLKGKEDVLASMIDDPIAGKQSVRREQKDREQGISPYLGHSLIHGPLLRLLDGNLEPLRLARTFGIGGCIANSAIGSRVHVTGADFKPHLCALSASV